jgi:prophage antirepressor-like protein
MTASALQFQETPFDVIDRNGQPWLKQSQIANVLYGIAKGGGQSDAAFQNAEKSLRRLFDRNKDEFTDSMTALIELETNGGKQQVRVFSLRGCHLLAMFARTKTAKEFRKWVLDIIDSHLQQNPHPAQPSEPPTITKAQQGELYTRATRIAGGDKKKMTAIWSRLRTHYRINGYTNLPADQFQDALETLDRYKQEYNQGAEILHISTIELEAMLTERTQALPPPAKEGELLPNPTKDDLIGILTRQITALEAQLQAAQNLSPARMILALKQEGHLVIEKGQDLPGQIVMHYVSPKRLTQLIHCATERLENFLREEVANA